MSTYKQRAANLGNAHKSTGPKTEQGKARSRMNAVKHGLTGVRCVLIEGEDPEEFEALCADLIAKYRPSTAFGRELVVQLAVETWRLRRVGGLEGRFVRACQEETRTEVEASFDEAYYQPLKDEADRRCTESFKNRPGTVSLDAILAAKLDGTYDSRFEKHFEEVKAEAKERGCEPPNRELTAAELAETYQVGAVNIFLDAEKSDTLDKLSRYQTSVLNNMFRILRLLEAEQKLTRVIDA
jgi:hypothetical protein